MRCDQLHEWQLIRSRKTEGTMFYAPAPIETAGLVKIFQPTNHTSKMGLNLKSQAKRGFPDQLFLEQQAESHEKAETGRLPGSCLFPKLPRLTTFSHLPMTGRRSLHFSSLQPGETSSQALLAENRSRSAQAGPLPSDWGRH